MKLRHNMELNRKELEEDPVKYYFRRFWDRLEKNRNKKD